MIRKTIFGAWFIACLVLLSGVVVGQFPDPELLRANELRNRGDYDGAIAIYTKALETAETKAKAEIFTLHAQTYFSKNEFDQVIQDCGARMKTLDLDGIITDYPDRAIKVFRNK